MTVDLKLILVALCVVEAIALVVQSYRLIFYKAYFDQKQRNRQIIEQLRKVKP